MSLSPPLFLLSQFVLLLLSLSARMEEEALDFDEIDVVVVLMGMLMTLGVISPDSLLLSGSNSVVKVMVVVVVMVAAKSNVFLFVSRMFSGVNKNIKMLKLENANPHKILKTLTIVFTFRILL